jgi:hypothetical protein
MAAQGGNTTSTGTPKPIAKATEPQVPEPKPAKLVQGRKPAGAAPTGSATNKPLLAATQCTKRAERAANAALVSGGSTLNTVAKGMAARTVASTPQAQPTPTVPLKLLSMGKNAAQELTALEPARREPEKPTQGNEPTKQASEPTEEKDNVYMVFLKNSTITHCRLCWLCSRFGSFPC